MDYRTLFLTYVGSLTIYTVFACLLALRNRRVRGLTWIAAGLIVGLLKVILQGLETHIPTTLSSLVVNELYLVSFVLQMIGLRWFVTRPGIRRRWPLYLIAALAALYAVLYVFRVPYIGNLINIPVICIFAFTGTLLIRRARGHFRQVAGWTAVFIFGQMAVSTYRCVLTNLRYAMPWMVADAQHDSRWIYSLVVMMAFSTCVILCEFWFFVVELQVELIAQSRTDALTGALNRRALYFEADREIARSLRAGQVLSVLLFDVDDFKALNDTHGHAGGDIVLQRLVTQVNSLLRSEDILARTGGEEFAILLPNTTLESAALVAERVRISLEGLTLPFQETGLRLSVSIGVAQLVPPAFDFDQVLQHADAAMYSAKRSGKNRIIVYANQPATA